MHLGSRCDVGKLLFFAAYVVGSRCQGSVSHSTGGAQNLFTYSWFWWFSIV